MRLVPAVVVVVAACGPTRRTVEPPPPPPALPDARPGPFTATVVEAGAFIGGSHGLAIDADGTLYASDTFGKPPGIHAYAPPYAGPSTPVAVPATQPAGLLVLPDALVVCDLKAGEVRRHARGAGDGAFVATPATRWTIKPPWNVAALPDGALVVVTYDGALARLAPDGTVAPITTGLDAPFDVVVAADGTVWVSEQVADAAKPGRVRRWTLDGTAVAEAAYAWNNPEGLALDGRGDLWVADTERGEVVRVAPDGAAEVIARAELPILIRALPDGDLVFTANKPDPTLYRIELR